LLARILCEAYDGILVGSFQRFAQGGADGFHERPLFLGSAAFQELYACQRHWSQRTAEDCASPPTVIEALMRSVEARVVAGHPS
jgi:hypothetical protein